MDLSKNLINIPFVSNDGEPIYCKKIKMKPKTSKFTTIEIHMSSKIILDLNPKNIPSVYVAIHDAKRNVNPFREGKQFEMGYINRFEVKEMFQQTLLPSPYDTNCTDYRKMWKENHEKGPLTKFECIEHCELEAFREKNNCVPTSIGISHTEKLCEHGEKVPKELIDHCNAQCGESCFERAYRFDYNFEKIKLDITPKEFCSGEKKWRECFKPPEKSNIYENYLANFRTSFTGIYRCD